MRVPGEGEGDSDGRRASHGGAAGGGNGVPTPWARGGGEGQPIQYCRRREDEDPKSAATRRPKICHKAARDANHRRCGMPLPEAQGSHGPRQSTWTCLEMVHRGTTSAMVVGMTLIRTHHWQAWDLTPCIHTPYCNDGVRRRGDLDPAPGNDGAKSLSSPLPWRMKPVVHLLAALFLWHSFNLAPS